MKRAWWLAILITAVLTVSGAARAQEIAAQGEKAAAAPQPPPPQVDYYRLNFSLRELEDGKLLNTRTYVTRMATVVPWDGRTTTASVRAGTKIPIAARNYEYQYVGVDIDCQLRPPIMRSMAGLTVTMDISSPASLEPGRPGATEPPILRQIRGSAIIPFEVGKPILVTSVDDVASKHQYQLELTITREK